MPSFEHIQRLPFCSELNDVVVQITLYVGAAGWVRLAGVLFRFVAFWVICTDSTAPGNKIYTRKLNIGGHFTNRHLSLSKVCTNGNQITNRKYSYSAEILCDFVGQFVLYGTVY